MVWQSAGRCLNKTAAGGVFLCLFPRLKQLSLALLLITFSNAWASEYDSLVVPQEVEGEIVNDLVWTIKMARLFTTVDPIRVEARLNNSWARELEFEGDPYPPKMPTLILTPQGKPPIAVKLDHRVKNFQFRGIGSWPSGKLALGRSVELFIIDDIRSLFGALPSGGYLLQVVYYKSDYSLKNYPDFKPRALLSPGISFVVRHTSLKDAEDANIKNSEVVLINLRADAKEASTDTPVGRTWTITNNSDFPIRFAGYGPTKEDKGEPISVLEDLEYWTPFFNWRREAGGVCGTGLITHTLQPKESVKADFSPGFAYYSAPRIYRYALHYRTSEHSIKRFRTTYSQAIQRQYRLYETKLY